MYSYRQADSVSNLKDGKEMCNFENPLIKISSIFPNYFLTTLKYWEYERAFKKIKYWKKITSVLNKVVTTFWVNLDFHCLLPTC